MDVFFDKKNNNPLSPWSTRCYRIRNCELTQYKKDCDEFKHCNDESIKQRYNICDIEQIFVHPKTPYILKLDVPSKYKENSVNLLLKLNNVNANVNKKKKETKGLQDVNQALFLAIYRLLSSSIKSESKCPERPLPSNICLALYYLLQRLYQHKAIQRTQFIFKERFPLKFVEKLYYDLIVNCKRFLRLDEEDLNNIHLLSITLLYTLTHMPTSLFCDSYCKELTDFVINAMDDDSDYKIAQIKQFILGKYSAKRTEYRNKHDFHLFNRYGFMTILFRLLHTISDEENTDTTGMSARDLAEIFGPCLQSKRYLFLCRSQDLSKNKKYHKKRRDKKYEAQFNRMVQVLIDDAPLIFPDFERIGWKIQTLIHCQGQERYMVKYYNDMFSLNTKTPYYIAPILLKNKDYGDFDGTLSSRSRTSSSHDDEEKNDKKYVVRVDEKYNLERKTSYHERSVYASDIGGSDLSDIVEHTDDVKVEQDTGANTNDQKEEIKYPDLSKNNKNMVEIKYDGESISEQHLSDEDNTDYKEPQHKQTEPMRVQYMTSMPDDDLYDDDNIPWHMFDECEQCMVPFMRLFGYYENNSPQMQETNKLLNDGEQAQYQQ